MKIRNGFVSNSSSTAFILDKRKPGVKEMLTKLRIGIPFPEDFSRNTAMAIGEGAVTYAKEWCKEAGYDDGDPIEEHYDDGSLGPWILYWANKLGVENTIFIRESDEDDGIFDIDAIVAKQTYDSYDFDTDKWHKACTPKELSEGKNGRK